MIPAGYMAKRVEPCPDGIGDGSATDIYSVSNCISKDFADYINFWKHNGFWLFDSPEIIRIVAKEAGVTLSGTTLFYYEVYEQEFDREKGRWDTFAPEASFTTNVLVPLESVLEGYDVVSFYLRTNPECSPLSCNDFATELPVNEHCLFAGFDEAFTAVEGGAFTDADPGALRIFAVYSVPKINIDAPK